MLVAVKPFILKPTVMEFLTRKDTVQFSTMIYVPELHFKVDDCEAVLWELNLGLR